MKLLFPFFFLLVLSCNTVKKEYVCGDHLCVDKKEFNEYFSKNLTIEIQSQKKKIKKIDLAKLNTAPINENKENKKFSKKEKRIKKKNEKRKLKEEKIRVLKERKIRENVNENKFKTPKLKKPNKNNIKNKISNNREQVKSNIDKIPEEKKLLSNEAEKNTVINSVKSENVKNICDKIRDCDIDKIAELLKKKGRDKPFPNITSN